MEMYTLLLKNVKKVLEGLPEGSFISILLIEILICLSLVDVNRYISIIVKVSFFNIEHYGLYLPVENGFTSRKEIIQGKYAISG